jgi:glucokinase
MSPIIAVDLGGTNIRAAYFPTPEPPPASQSRHATNADDGPDAVIDRIVSAIEDQRPQGVQGLRVGLGAPGPLDPQSGQIIDAPNLPGWQDIPLRERLETRLGLPVQIGNDANLAALGEWRFGAGRGTRNMIYLTISTGIGGGVIVDGHLLVGSHGLAAELGHMTADPSGPVCSCGQVGHLEALAAGPAIARWVVEQLEAGVDSQLAKHRQERGPLTALDVAQAAQGGDELGMAAFQRTGDILGRHLASLAHAFDPEVIVLGGGVSFSGDLLFQPTLQSMRSHLMHPIYSQDLRILPAELGDDAGLVGAMVLANKG